MRRGLLGLLGVALALGALVPVSDVVDVLARRFNTVSGFRAEVLDGLVTLKLSVLAGGVFLGLVMLFPSHLWPKVSPTSERPGPWNPKERFIVAGTVVLAFAVRLIRCDQSLQDDEWFYYVQYISHGPLVVVTRSIDLNNQILSNLVASCFLKLAPLSEASYRLPGMLVGALAVVPVYALVRRYGGARAALLGALAYAVHSYSVGGAQEARATGYLFLLAPSAILLYQRIQEEESTRLWIAYIAVQTLVVWSHLLSAMFPTVLLIYGLWERRRDPAFRVRWLVSYAAIVLASLALYALHIAIWFRVLGFYGAIPHPLFERFPAVARDWTVLTLPAALRILPLAAAAIGAVLLWKDRRREPVRLLGVSAVLFVAAVGLAPFPLPSRYAAFAFVLWVVLWSRGAAAPGWRSAPSWALLALFAADLVGSFHFGKFDSKWAAQTVGARAETGARVGYTTDTVALEWYARRQGLRPVRFREGMEEPPPWICLAEERRIGWVTVLLKAGAYENVSSKRSADGRTLEIWHRKTPR